MELTPKVFRDVQFREKLRGGYHPEDVDEFLEQAAVAAEALLEKLRQATERAQRAEQVATDASSTDDTLKRMLVMAQKTADQAVREARDEADKIVSDARRQAEALVVDGEERGRRAYDTAIADGRAALARLEESRRQRQADVDALQGWVQQHKANMLASLRDALAIVEGVGLDNGGSPEPQAVADKGAGDRAVAAAQAGPSVPEEPARQPETAAEPETVAEPVADQAPAAAGDPGPEVLDAGGATEPGTEPTEGTPGVADGGQWDPRYLDDLQSAHTPGRHAVQSSQVDAVAQGAGTVRDTAGQGEDTVAFDERALDSFFKDQDLGHARGLGRFRRGR